jgi:fluoroacetyl-CoA thioesterase
VLPIPVGSTATLDIVVTEGMTCDFDEMGKVHPVCATYTMAKHFKEAGRNLLVPHLKPGEAASGPRGRWSTARPVGWATPST